MRGKVWVEPTNWQEISQMHCGVTKICFVCAVCAAVHWLVIQLFQIFSKPNFQRGMISFAGGGPDTRSTDVFITFMTGNANGTPRAPWETPFGIIDEAVSLRMLVPLISSHSSYPSSFTGFRICGPVWWDVRFCQEGLRRPKDGKGVRKTTEKSSRD